MQGGELVALVIGSAYCAIVLVDAFSIAVYSADTAERTVKGTVATINTKVDSERWW